MPSLSQAEVSESVFFYFNMGAIAIWLFAKRLYFISLLRMLGDILVYIRKRNLFYCPGEVCRVIEIRVLSR